ncbi:MAG: cupin domain-containing protein [Bryobacteraceae bacterium]
MDVLSEVLRVVKLEGALFFNAEFSAPWCIESAQSRALAPLFSTGPKHLILYHFLTEGRAYARVSGAESEQLVAGDIVVFPRGDSHYLGNGAPERPVDSIKTFASNLRDGMKVVRFGGGGEITKFVCGFMACDPRLSDVVLGSLPRMLKVHISNEPSSQWIQNSIRFSVDESSGNDAGSSLVLAKLSELLFVETLRRYINDLPAEQTGWLAGVRDPVAGKALALMHQNLGHHWSLEELARQVGVSRTRLAERFRCFLRVSPMAYLTASRLNLGAEILQSTEDGVAEVAARIGYGSEAAFNRAFRRAFDCPPAQFRRNSRAALHASLS